MENKQLTKEEKDFLKKVFEKTMSKYRETIIKLQNA
jgi:hypothetical protein